MTRKRLWDGLLAVLLILGAPAALMALVGAFLLVLYALDVGRF